MHESRIAEKSLFIFGGLRFLEKGKTPWKDGMVKKMILGAEIGQAKGHSHRLELRVGDEIKKRRHGDRKLQSVAL